MARAKPGKKEEKGSDQKVLAAYIELAHKIGVANITLQKIADQANVAFGTVRYYFAGEGVAIHDEAFKLMLQLAYTAIENIFFESRSKPGFNPVHSYVETMFDWIFARPTEGAFLMYMYYLSATEEKVELPVSQTVEKARLRVEGLINEAVGMGLYVKPKDLRTAATAIHAAVVGHGFTALTFKNKKSLEMYKGICIQVVNALLEPVAPAGRSR